MLIEKVGSTIRKYSLLSRGDRVVVAVSGGPDSVCLVSVLQALAKGLDLNIHVAHLDHSFRGEGSAADARFVADLAEKLGLPATTGKIDVPALCRERGLSAQAGAREARYGFLEEVARTVGANRIATGHTADDQAETLVMRLLRGAGLSGLSGIPPKRGTIVRPLIETTRQEVLAYLDGAGLSFVADPSNDLPLYTRNRIRQEVMPVLAKLNPSVAVALAAEAALIRDEDEALDAFTAPLLESLLAVRGDEARIGREGFNGLLPGVRRRILRLAAERMGAGPHGLSAVRTAEALGFMTQAQTGRTMELAPALELSRDYDAFVIRPAGPPEAFDRSLAVPGVTALPGLSMTAEAEVVPADAHTGSPGNYLWQAVFDYATITGPLRLRSRRPGDRMQPAGMGGRSRKLQDLFTDVKMPRAERDRVPVLASGEDILWVPGVRTDGRFLPGPGTTQVLIVTILSSDVRRQT